MAQLNMHTLLMTENNSIGHSWFPRVLKLKQMRLYFVLFVTQQSKLLDIRPLLISWILLCEYLSFICARISPDLIFLMADKVMTLLKECWNVHLSIPYHFCTSHLLVHMPNTLLLKDGRISVLFLFIASLCCLSDQTFLSSATFIGCYIKQRNSQDQLIVPRM